MAFVPRLTLHMLQSLHLTFYFLAVESMFSMKAWGQHSMLLPPPTAKGNKSPKSCAFCKASPHWGVLGSNLPAVLHRFNTYHLLAFVTTPTVMMHNFITSQWSFKFSLYIDHAEFTYQITPTKKKQKTVLKENSNKNLSFHSALLPSSSLNAFHYYFPSCKQVSSITTKWSF